MPSDCIEGLSLKHWNFAWDRRKGKFMVPCQRICVCVGLRIGGRKESLN